MLRLLAPVLLATLAAGAGAQLLPRERTAIEDALTVAGIRSGEVKLPASTAPMTPEHAAWRALANDPLGTIDGWLATMGENPTSVSTWLATGSTVTQDGTIPELPAEVPAALRGPVSRLLSAISGANAEIRAALKDLSLDERRRLIEALPQWAGRRAGLKPEFAKGDPFPSGATAERALFGLLARARTLELRAAGSRLDAAVEAEIAALKAAAPTVGPIARLRFKVGDIVVEIAGTGDDVHSARDAALVIDLGGNDRYAGRAGAGIGYAAVLLDLGGDAAFDAPDAGPGCGLLGVGIARLEGTASGRSGLLAFGAGVAGFGRCSVTGTADLQSRALSQGFGFAGTGILTTGPGHDSLRLGTLGQGCGISGGIGLLLDSGGDDRYECRGIAADDFDGTKESCAQGYGEAGAGYLIDAGGDDLCESGTRGQGAGEAHGIGLLLDTEGDDLRHAARFAQGYGSDGCGILADFAGDDVNVTRGGESHGGAGTGGVGLFFDRAGDDAVIGGGAGIAALGGIALFFDGGGQDQFGVRTRADEAGGVGLFVALGSGAEGFDLPPVGSIRPGSDGSAASAIGTGPVPAGLEPIAPGSLPPNADRIARAVGLLVSRRGGLRAGAVRELTGFGKPGLDAAVERLDDLDEGGIDALAEIVVALGELGRRSVATRLENPTVNMLKLAGRARIPVATGALLAAIDDDARRHAALEAIAGGGDPALAPAVLPLVISEEPGVPRLAMRALLRVGGITEEGSLRALVTTPDPALRLMVQTFLARFPTAIAFGRDLSQDPDGSRASAGIAILGLVGSDEALRIAGTGLNSPTQQIRLAALRTLNGRVPEGWRSRILELQRDTDPIVAATARGVELGR